MFHLFTIEEETFSLLQQIFSIPEIKKKFALAGGTSLALQIGHRRSVDLDIFSSTPLDTRELEILLSSTPGFHFQPVNSTRNMLFTYINGIKCDFVYEPSTLLQPYIENNGIALFHTNDIAAMKMHTVCGRGRKKDFFDIYALTEVMGWNNMLHLFEKKYGPDQFYFLWKSIAYFNDADDDPDITGFSPFVKSWAEVKQHITTVCR
ncbi:MAG TPA: nucleotidyl transferase AbiEii/AbiGii toxin family protein [Ferruginibacter sp.]|nr:nucleotidyl transferase AbiEii/AbiGii toxin family protein [Ferruginibacter sp.]HMP22336.1 nucleotidyl transferase AbiEii/AbiGii toxin family protein [Ferruginibacter sp.]